MQSLERGLAVLLAFSGRTSPMAPGEVAALTGLSRPAARRLIITLAKAGYVREDGGRYALTPRVLQFGAAYLSSQSLHGVAEPHMERLSATIQESCSLATLDDLDAVVVARVLTRRILTVNLEVGARLPAHASSLGRVLLAALPADRLDALLDTAELRPLTPSTLTDPVRLRAELARVRAQGWCLVDEEVERGVRSVAAPVTDARGRVVAALAASVHAHRVDRSALRRDLLDPVRSAAAAISSDLGASPAHA